MYEQLGNAMKTQLTLITALLTLALSGCQVEGLATGNDPVESNNSETTTTNTTATGSTAPTNDTVPTENPEGVMLYWSAPTQRVNGTAVGMDDIQGYEIRYKKQSEGEYTTILVLDAYTDQLPIDDIDTASEYQFEVAAIDKYGIYSTYVTASHI